MCEIVSQSGADYIKTSTGFSTAGATFDDVALFKAHVAPPCEDQAAGGIASLRGERRAVPHPGRRPPGHQRIVKLAKAME